MEGMPRFTGDDRVGVREGQDGRVRREEDRTRLQKGQTMRTLPEAESSVQSGKRLK